MAESGPAIIMNPEIIVDPGSPEPEIRTLPVGLFDSGWGGLTILQACQNALPSERWWYLADHAYCPYGALAPEQIETRAVAIARWLVGRPVKVIVVACNTASSYALESVRAVCPGIPVVGVTPAVKPAALLSNGRPVIVLVTPATAKSAYLRSLIHEFAAGLRVEIVPAPGLVELVESGAVRGDALRAALEVLLAPALAQQPGAIVLGCTHYPFLRRTIEVIAGRDVLVVDSGAAIARRLRQVLLERSWLAPDGREAPTGFFTTGDPQEAARVAGELLGEPVQVELAYELAPIGSETSPRGFA